MQFVRCKVFLFGFLAFLLCACAAHAQKDDVYIGYFDDFRAQCMIEGKDMIAMLTGDFSEPARVDSAVRAACQCIIDKAQAQTAGRWFFCSMLRFKSCRFV